MISTADGLLDRVPVDLGALQTDATRMLSELAPDRELSVRLCDDQEIQRLNALYRGKNTPTDVLSFPQDLPLFGDVVISLDTAARQAAERHHPLALELRILLAHGLAHLAGHDHHEASEAALMAQVERDLLHAIGVRSQGLVDLAQASTER